MLEVYVKNGCPYCEKQLDFLKKKEIDYKLYNVSDDEEALRRAREELNVDQVPVVVEDGAIKSVGFEGGG